MLCSQVSLIKESSAVFTPVHNKKDDGDEKDIRKEEVKEVEEEEEAELVRSDRVAARHLR